jgi:hypothetical protein
LPASATSNNDVEFEDEEMESLTPAEVEHRLQK